MLARLLLYVQPQRGGQKKVVGQAERTAALDEDVPPARFAGGPETALPEPETPVASVADIARAAEEAEAALTEEDGDAPEPEPAGSRKQRRASSSRDRKRRRRKRGKR